MRLRIATLLMAAATTAALMSACRDESYDDDPFATHSDQVTTLRRLTDHEVDRELRSAAREILRANHDAPIGSEIRFRHDGRPYVARLEPHHHSESSGRELEGWHKGVSLFAVEAPE